MRVKHPDSHLAMSQSCAIYSVISSYPRVSPLFGQQSVLMFLNLDVSFVSVVFAGAEPTQGSDGRGWRPSSPARNPCPLAYPWRGMVRNQQARGSCSFTKLLHLHPTSTPFPDGSTHQSLDPHHHLSLLVSLPRFQHSLVHWCGPFTSPILPGLDR